MQREIEAAVKALELKKLPPVEAKEQVEG